MWNPLHQDPRFEAALANAALRIGYFGVLASELVAAPLRRLKLDVPRVEIELIDLPSGLPADQLNEGALDIALLGHVTTQQANGFFVKPIARVPMLLALPPGPRAGEAPHR